MTASADRPRIQLIHATAVAMAPIGEALARLWPEAEAVNLLDDSLSLDRERGLPMEHFVERLGRLIAHAVANGARAILFTCSAFGPMIEACRGRVAVPVLKPNEAMIEEAISAGRRIGLFATFEPSLVPVAEELREAAARRGIPIDVTTVYVPGAGDALRRGDVAAHDALIAKQARVHRELDAICFTQFSMTRAAALTFEAAGKRVLTTPDSAVALLRRRLSASRPGNGPLEER